MKRGDSRDDLEKAFASLREVPAPDKERQATKRAAFLSRAGRLRGAVPDQQGGIPALRPGLSRRLAMAGTVVAIVLVLVVGGGGVLYAAEGAVPGDPLYGIDRAVESARLSLTSEPQAEMELLLSLAEERLQEAETLSGKGDAGNLELALSGYGATISSLAQTLSGVSGLEEETLTAVVDQSFSAHEARLAGILQEASGDEGEQEEGEATQGCVGAALQPIAASLATSYGVPYEQIMGWFCDGNYGLGEIMHALETGEKTGVPAEDLLGLKTELGGWGRVWQGLGLIGRSEDKPSGQPEDKPGGQPADRPVGPPEDKPGGQPADRPVGPPEDKPVGPPEDKSVGQPADRPVGPPEDKPVGPPEDKPGGQPADRPVGPPEDKPGGPKEGKPEGSPDDAGSDLCVGVEPHPRAAELAEDYGVAVEEIMTWFCEGGYGFGDILLALKTSQESDVPAGDLLARKTELGGWGEVWQELGLIGKPAKVPGGPSKEKPGGSDKEKPGGKP
jgi:hypothetical protein